MTDDVSHGLALLADEAEPAPIDSHDVITRARTRTRDRRTTATVFAAVVALSALAVTLQGDRADTPPAKQNERASVRLTAQLTAALPDLIPADWETRPRTPTETRQPQTFYCYSDGPWITASVIAVPGPGDALDPMTETSPRVDLCGAQSWYRDVEGEIELHVEVDPGKTWFFDPCVAPQCEEHVLPDGTRWRMSPNSGVSQYSGLQQIESLRPDGTHIQVFVTWQNNRATPPLTVDELLAFTDRFDY
jgi:hypothetical protein